MVNRLNTEKESSFLVLAGGWVLDPGRWNGEADVWIRDGVIDEVVSPDVSLLQEAVCLDVTGLRRLHLDLLHAEHEAGE
jgi:hypothetical protein